MTFPIIFIDDDKSIRLSLGQTLELENYNVQTFDNARAALGELSSQYPGVVISDINMPGMDGISFLEHALRIDDELVVIMLTGHGDITTAVDAMRLGAYDFIEKPFSTEQLLDVIKRAGEKRELLLENRELRKELEVHSGPGPKIMGNSPAIRHIRRVLGHLALSDQAIILHGDSGTGKTLMARFLHDHSPRHSGSFVTLDANRSEHHSQLPHYISPQTSGIDLPSTLFIRHAEQLPEQAIIDLKNLLATPQPPKLILATTLPIRNANNQDHFLAKLAFKFGIVDLAIPPLSGRHEDIMPLFHHFLRADCSRFGLDAAPIPADLEQQLLDYPWHDNVRELRLFAERYALMGHKASLSLPHKFPANDPQSLPTLSERVAHFENQLLHDALRRHQGCLKDVQHELGLARKTLYDKMRKYNIDKGEYK